MKEEWFPLVNEKGETIGKATRKECHNGSKMLHPVVHLHIFNKAGDLYLPVTRTGVYSLSTGD